MHFGSAISRNEDSLRAIEEACSQASEALGGARPHLAVLFVSASHVPRAEEILQHVQRTLDPESLIGCSAAGLIGGALEIEQEPSLALWLGHLPGVAVKPFHLLPRMGPSGIEFAGWSKVDGSDPPRGMILLADPFTTPVEVLLSYFETELPSMPVIGGLSSTGMSQGENRLFFGEQLVLRGAVGVVLSGNLEMHTVVSQGCRPIGRPFIITKGERNVIEELAGKPAFLRLKELLESLSPKERERARRGLHIGRLINEYSSEFAQGDFLIRSIVHIDASTNALRINDIIRRGQTVMFQVRDAEAADEDLLEALKAEHALAANRKAQGALLFSCNGRGSHLFGGANHDIGSLVSQFGQIPTAGFFAAGEIGPVSDRNFLHGFTASMAIFFEPGG